MIDADRQPDMFAAAGPLPPPSPIAHLPSLARQRLDALLAAVRAADRMPWDEQQAGINALVFHNTANWLPPAEANALRAAFAQELDRLRTAG